MNNNYYKSMFKKYPDIVNVKELRIMLGGISKKLAYHLLQNNIIKSIKIGRQYKIAKAEEYREQFVKSFNLQKHIKTQNDEQERKYMLFREKLHIIFLTFKLSIPTVIIISELFKVKNSNTLYQFFYLILDIISFSLAINFSLSFKRLRNSFKELL